MKNKLIAIIGKNKDARYLNAIAEIHNTCSTWAGSTALITTTNTAMAIELATQYIKSLGSSIVVTKSRSLIEYDNGSAIIITRPEIHKLRGLELTIFFIDDAINTDEDISIAAMSRVGRRNYKSAGATIIATMDYEPKHNDRFITRMLSGKSDTMAIERVLVD